MADEAIGNGDASDIEFQSGEEDGISNSDTDFGKDSKVSELNRKIKELDQENSGLIRKKEESDGRIKELSEEIGKLRTNGAAMKDRMEQMQKEIEQSVEERKALQVISDRAIELETQVSRLQHDLVSSMSESEEASAEIRKLNDALDELKQSNLDKERKVEELEKEKASLLQRLEREVAEIKKSKPESEFRIRELEEKLSLMEAKQVDNRNQGSKREEETNAKISEKDGKILQLQKAIEGLESKVVENSSALQKLQNEKDEIEKQKFYLEEDKKKSQEKLMEMEAKTNRLQREFEESEKSVRKFKEENRNYTATARDIDTADTEKGSKGLNLQWQTAVACTGTVAAAAALLYLSYARRR